jgi:hypothetical protein
MTQFTEGMIDCADSKSRQAEGPDPRRYLPRTEQMISLGFPNHDHQELPGTGREQWTSKRQEGSRKAGWRLDWQFKCRASEKWSGGYP